MKHNQNSFFYDICNWQALKYNNKLILNKIDLFYFVKIFQIKINGKARQTQRD